MTYLNLTGITNLPSWLERKFQKALKRRDKARAILSGLQNIQNPHSSTPTNYTIEFFKEQWNAQRNFQTNHTEDEEERRMKLVLLYKKEAVLELLRNRLRGPEIFLATEEEVNNLLASILELSENLREELNELTGEQDMRGVMNGMFHMSYNWYGDL